MNRATVLQEWSDARAALAASLAPRAVTIALGRHRSLSGFHWRGDLVVTAAEALGGTDSAVVVSAAGEHDSSVIACDLATDVAVIRVPAGAISVPAARVSAAPGGLEAGTGVVFAGRSRRGPLVSFGSVRLAGPAWSSRRGGTIDQRLEFEGSIDARFEGALVADFSGTTQAMLVSGPRASLLGIPASTLDRIVGAVERHGYLPRPYLGLRLQLLWLDEATRTRWGRSARGVPAIAGVEAASPAEAVGLVAGDLIDSIDGVAVEDIEAVAARLAQTSPGQRLELRLRRGGEAKVVSIQVAEWKAPQARVPG
jgi:S1-C subfamily serine protease